jgi:hypothetical protein
MNRVIRISAIFVLYLVAWSTIEAQMPFYSNSHEWDIEFYGKTLFRKQYQIIDCDTIAILSENFDSLGRILERRQFAMNSVTSYYYSASFLDSIVTTIDNSRRVIVIVNSKFSSIKAFEANDESNVFRDIIIVDYDKLNRISGSLDLRSNIAWRCQYFGKTNLIKKAYSKKHNENWKMIYSGEIKNNRIQHEKYFSNDKLWRETRYTYEELYEACALKRNINYANSSMENEATCRSDFFIWSEYGTLTQTSVSQGKINHYFWIYDTSSVQESE